MNIVGLQTFVSIVETGSLVRASEQLNVTQSTVTARLRTLEQELGATLLLRHKSGVTLTASGTKLLGYAEIMIGLWRQARQETAPPAGTDRPGQGKGSLILLTFPSLMVSVAQG